MLTVRRQDTRQGQTAAIVAALFQRHTPPEWAAFDELRVATGYGTTAVDSVAWDHMQRLDFWALNLYPSKGFRSVAYEVKVSRGDFARELADPTKRAPAEALAGECYFATPAGLLKTDEVPEGWGLVEITAAGARLKKAATQRPAPDWPASFIAAIARRACRIDSGDETREQRALWRYAGKNLTEADLLKLLAERQHDLLMAAREEAVAKDRERQEYTRLRDLERAVAELTGGWAPTSAELRSWAATARTSGATAREAQRLTNMVGQAERLATSLRELQARLVPGAGDAAAAPAAAAGAEA